MRLTDFAHAEIPAEAEQLRSDVRAFLDREMGAIPPIVRADSWMAFDADFSRKLGAAKLIGLTMPERFGGRDLGTFARYVVNEELLAAGAPIFAHWIADRQSAPLLLRYGTAEQQERYIPPIVRGERYFCIGMSEPNAGSDLASIRSKATPKGDGWYSTARSCGPRTRTARTT